MDLDNFTFTKGQALVLVGPQGCGKTEQARQIADRHGTFAEFCAATLEDNRQFIDILGRELDTVVVDGVPTRPATQAKIKELLSTEAAAIRRPYSAAPSMVKAPNFIFCTSSGDPLPGVDGNRRFFVVRMR